MYEALRCGDLAAAEALRSRQEVLAVSLHAAGMDRTEAAEQLAGALGLTANRLTLSLLADHLPEPAASELRGLRERLRDAAGDLAALQRRNANLIGRLRSYFRDVLADLTAADAPVRYGPSGARLAPAGGAAIQANG